MFKIMIEGVPFPPRLGRETHPEVPKTSLGKEEAEPPSLKILKEAEANGKLIEVTLDVGKPGYPDLDTIKGVVAKVGKETLEFKDLQEAVVYLSHIVAVKYVEER